MTSAAVMSVVLVFSLAMLGYVYVGYPILLGLLVRIRGARQVHKADITPNASFVISAYNEAHVIRRKLENALGLMYPRAALEIVVVSDASDDGTDEIVAEYAHRGVKLVRQKERRGKTAGLNHAVPSLTGDIVIFSDANAIYQPDALLKLARNFADPGVGCVTGEARYVAGDTGAADVGERMYWGYEIQIKRLETGLGSMVGGDGAIYAIRRALWRELPENAINDFLNPLQIVEAGWRSVYEPEAVCHEETAGRVRAEYRRRVRIVSRSWRAVFQASGVLNPLRVGLFTWSLVSHKILRWLTGLFMTFAAIAASVRIAAVIAHASAATLGMLAFVLLVVAATRPGQRALGMMAYFSIIYAASMVGVFKGVRGHVSGVWTTPRQAPVGSATRPVLPIGLLLHCAVALALLVAALYYTTVSQEQFSRVVFWTCASVLVFVYAGYPAVLALIRKIAARTVRRGAVEPSVCVFITANDEQEVIGAKLRNTLALDYPPHLLEIVVASDGSVDATNKVVREFAPRVRLLEFTPRRGKIAAINDGMLTVQSEIVVFSDANTFLQPDAIRAIVRNFADDDVGAVSGDVVLVGNRAALGRSEDIYYWYERWVQRAESDVWSMIGADGALYALRRSLYAPPAADTILDDLSIPMAVIRAGRRVVYEPEARAFEHGVDSAKEEFARKSRVVAGAVQFLRRHDSTVPVDRPQAVFSLVSHKGLRWMSPGFAMCALLASLTLAPTSWIYWLAAVGQLSVFGLGVAGCIPTLRRFSPVALAHYYCLVQAAAAVGFLRGWSGSQPVTWRRFGRVSVESV